MRISHDQATAIRGVIEGRLPQVEKIILFGSRADDHRHGGDLDILIEAAGPVPIMQRAALMRELEDETGLPVDLIIRDTNLPPRPIEEIARSTGIPL